MYNNDLNDLSNWNAVTKTLTLSSIGTSVQIDLSSDITDAQLEKGIEVIITGGAAYITGSTMILHPNQNKGVSIVNGTSYNASFGVSRVGSKLNITPWNIDGWATATFTAVIVNYHN